MPTMNINLSSNLEKTLLPASSIFREEVSDLFGAVNLNGIVWLMVWRLSRFADGMPAELVSQSRQQAAAKGLFLP